VISFYTKNSFNKNRAFYDQEVAVSAPDNFIPSTKMQTGE
jgi:hypothetical protein